MDSIITLPYKKEISPRYGKVLVPKIPVNIAGPKDNLTLDMLLDSGAAISLIPFSAGQEIGLTYDSLKMGTVSGIGEGHLPYIQSQIVINIQGVEFPIRVGWSLVEEVPPILGRLDVFDHFNIEFRQVEDRIRLTPN